jgi:hypothetical protein
MSTTTKITVLLIVTQGIPSKMAVIFGRTLPKEQVLPRKTLGKVRLFNSRAGDLLQHVVKPPVLETCQQSSCFLFFLSPPEQRVNT